MSIYPNWNLELIMFKEETLSPSLLGYIEECHLMTFFRHPFCVMPYAKGAEKESSQINAMINHMVEKRESMIMDMESEGNYTAVLSIVERPFRLEYALKYLHLVNDYEYWDIVDYVWTDSESPSVNLNVWESIFKINKSSNPTLKTKTVKTMDSVVTVYRGGDEKGLSWTLDKEKAAWFATRFNSNQLLMTGLVHKSDILHYTDSCGEQEIVALPSSVNVINEEYVN